MAIVALRVAPVFGCAVTVTVPLPVPEPLTVTHAAPEDAVHVHAVVVVTVSVAEPPAAGRPIDVGDAVNAHGGGVPAVQWNCATIGAVRLRAAALFWLAVPVTRPL